MVGVSLMVVEVVVEVVGLGIGGLGWVLEGLVLVQGFVEGALGGGFVASEEFQRVGFLAGGAGELGEEVGGGLVLG
jgi:hypothetical protein